MKTSRTQPQQDTREDGDVVVKCKIPEVGLYLPQTIKTRAFDLKEHLWRPEQGKLNVTVMVMVLLKERD